jgi:hypothetical protein
MTVHSTVGAGAAAAGPAVAAMAVVAATAAVRVVAAVVRARARIVGSVASAEGTTGTLERQPVRVVSPTSGLRRPRGGGGSVGSGTRGAAAMAMFAA